MAAPTGHMACAVCLAPSVSGEEEHGRVSGFCLPLQLCGGICGVEGARLCLQPTMLRAPLRHAGSAWLLLHQAREL